MSRKYRDETWTVEKVILTVSSDWPECTSSASFGMSPGMTKLWVNCDTVHSVGYPDNYLHLVQEMPYFLIIYYLQITDTWVCFCADYHRKAVMSPEFEIYLLQVQLMSNFDELQSEEKS